jgi:hypothetical protein
VRRCVGGAGLRPGDTRRRPRRARQWIKRRAVARERRDRGRPHRRRSWVGRKGEQERRRGEKAAALGLAYRQEELAAMSRIARHQLWTRLAQTALRRCNWRRQRTARGDGEGESGSLTGGGVERGRTTTVARSNSGVVGFEHGSLLERPYTGLCAALPRPANRGVPSGDRATDRWVPLISEHFQINKPEFYIPPKKNR